MAHRSCLWQFPISTCWTLRRSISCFCIYWGRIVMYTNNWKNTWVMRIVLCFKRDFLKTSAFMCSVKLAFSSIFDNVTIRSIVHSVDALNAFLMASSLAHRHIYLIKDCCRWHGTSLNISKTCIYFYEPLVWFLSEHSIIQQSVWWPLQSLLTSDDRGLHMSDVNQIWFLW